MLARNLASDDIAEVHCGGFTTCFEDLTASSRHDVDILAINGEDPFVHANEPHRLLSPYRILPVPGISSHELFLIHGLLGQRMCAHDSALLGLSEALILGEEKRSRGKATR